MPATPPVDPDFLARLLRMSALHESAIDFKSRLVCMGYYPHRTNKLYIEPLKPNAPNDSNQMFSNFVWYTISHLEIVTFSYLTKLLDSYFDNHDSTYKVFSHQSALEMYKKYNAES
jgi:hypothetical protein